MYTNKFKASLASFRLSQSFLSERLRCVLFLALAILFLGVTTSQAQPFAYVPNLSNNNVSVIDTATNTVVTTTPVGFSPFGAAVTPDGDFVYVTNAGGDNVSVIDTATNTVVTTIPVGTAPEGVAVTPNGASVYVTNLSSNNVSVINTATNTVATTIPVGTAPRGVAVTPDGATVYVANISSNTVSVINTTTNTVVTTIAVGTNPNGVAVTPNGAFVYVTNFNSNNVSVIVTATNTELTRIAVGGTNPWGVAITPDGNFVYVTNFSSNNVSVINTSTNTVVTTIAVGTAPEGVDVTPDGDFVYVANQFSGNVSVIDTATNAVIATVSTGGQPVALAKFIGPAAPRPQLTALSPAKIWVGLKNSDAVGLRLDLKAEVSVNGTKVGEGQLNNVSSGSSGFNNARLNEIPLTLFGPVDVSPGDTLILTLSVRRTCFGGGHNSGTPRLWFNDNQANSRFDATIDGTTSDFFLRDGFALATTPGPGPKQTQDVSVNNQAACPTRSFAPFGNWSMTLP